MLAEIVRWSFILPCSSSAMEIFPVIMATTNTAENFKVKPKIPFENVISHTWLLFNYDIRLAQHAVDKFAHCINPYHDSATRVWKSDKRLNRARSDAPTTGIEDSSW